MALLSRDQFREGVFKRDQFTCVVPHCGAKADDAHHIIERRLWKTPTEHGGYFMANGASVCEYHHQYGAEACVIQPQVFRLWLNLPTVLPASFNSSKSYDKWGKELRRPTRKVIKYPSTPFLPNSPSPDSEFILPTWKCFLEQPLVMTIKMDGSNVCLSHDLVAARNGSTATHPSFSLLKERWNNIYKALIPPHIQLFGEWLFAQHSIVYDATLPLSNYFQLFSVYDQDKEMFLGWNNVCQWARLLNVPTVPVLFEGVFHNEGMLMRHVEALCLETVDTGHEGLVVRTTYPFPYGSFEGYITSNGTSSTSSWHVAAIAKYVRYNHIQTDKDWSKKVIKNHEVQLEY